MSLLQHPGAIPPGATGYEVSQSVMFDGTRSEFLTRDVSSAGSRTTATISIWFKRGRLGQLGFLWEFGNTDNDNGRIFARLQADDTLRIMGGSSTFLQTNRRFRDPNAWMHLVVAFDTTSGTADNRIRMYINGVEETSFSTRTNPSQNDILGLNFQKQTIGSSHVDSTGHFDGYMCEIVYQDGTASAPTEFGEFDSDSNIWKPIDPSDKPSGTNKFYLDFEDSSNLGNDASGGTDFTENNIDSSDVFLDTCTNNFCTWNYLTGYMNSSPSATGFTAGNLLRQGGNGGYNQCYASIGVSKEYSDAIWYWEVENTGVFNSSTMEILVGMAKESQISAGNSHTDIRNSGIAEFASNLIPSFSQNSHANTIFGMLLDMSTSNVKLKFYVNDTLVKTTENLPTTEYLFPYGAIFGTSGEMIANFGQGAIQEIGMDSANADAGGIGAFEFATKSGRALCTKNLAEHG